jgi:hypothetical protein
MVLLAGEHRHDRADVRLLSGPIKSARARALCRHTARSENFLLLSLAPDIQERLLFLAAAEKGRDAISEKKI